MNNFQRGALIALLIVVVSIAAIVPVGIGYVFARRTQFQEDAARLSVVADAALFHAEDVTRRLSGALGDIGKVAALPCSTPYLHELRRITLAHQQVRDAGAYDRDGNWQCSSLLGAVSAGTLDGLHLPAPDWRSRDGVSAWYGLARLPGGKESVVMGRNGFYIAVDPTLYLEDRTATSGNLAVINTEASRVIARSPATDA
ncbi:CSS-motif domain-containing protein, partial [Caballeronia sp. BR00000012568055]|uniref:CSS-motif domain-containing protein n=1 Tax=Caballeronia sp. BR00000012568055 TaxID=2918761 RepID=UPI0023F9011D